MGKLTRRDFLRASVIAVAGAALSACGGSPTPEKEATAAPAPGARVAAVRGDDLYAMTREVLQTLGGIEQVVKPGETVFIKPNMVTLPWAAQGHSPFRLGECTKPEIVIAVAEECLRVGAAEVIVGDGSQMPRFDWKFARTLDGSTNLVAEAARLSSEYEGKMTVVCLDADTPEWIEVPTGISLGKVAISSLVARADRVISIPVAKTHTLAVLTLSMKNFIGIIPLERYGWHNGPNYDRIDLHRHDYTSKAVNQLVFDLTQAVKPDLAIVDFSIGVEGNGPTTDRGRTVDVKDRLGSWLLLASTDPVAADATAARVMNHDAAYVDRILTMAREQGLGKMREEKIEIVGESLDDLRVEWQPAELDYG
ncbi:MAG: DUF362 domain-containing protein [Anaerolineae bacterium]|nr:DUF362 domain-containing protein [Anaerolineae bacterium]